MKDYLNAEEANDYMTIRFTTMVLKRILEQWGARNNLTKEEIKHVKYGITYMTKFFSQVEQRLNPKENAKIDKRLQKFEFKLVDDFQMQKIFRQAEDAMKTAVIPRGDFDVLCEQVMDINCKDCTKHWSECNVYQAFDNNFAVEPTGYELDNCKYAYSSGITFKKAVEGHGNCAR